jgi:S1-C subfamily serine protease
MKKALLIALALFAAIVGRVWAQDEDDRIPDEVFNHAVDNAVLIIGFDAFWDRHYGTGVVLDGGLILTSYSIVHDRLCVVQFPLRAADGTLLVDPDKYPQKQSHKCIQVWHDAKLDLVLLKLKDAVAAPKGITLSSSSLTPGENLLVIGACPDEPMWLSCEGRARRVTRGKWLYRNGREIDGRVIEFIAGIRPDDHGAPILNNNGQLVGIVSALESGSRTPMGIDVTEIRAFVDRFRSITKSGK